MKYKIELLIVVSAVFCLVLAQIAPASYTTKSVYIDGQNVVDVNSGDVLDFSAGVVRIGAEGPDTYIYNEYIGKIDEFAVYGGLLAASRISAHYNAKDSNSDYTAAVEADAPVLWLRFQDASVDSGATAENSGTSTTDGRYFMLGSLTPMSLVQGINADSNALYIPDSGDQADGHKVEVPDNGEFGTGLGSHITVEVWVNFTDIAAMSGNDYPRFYTTGGGYGLHIDNDPNILVIHGGGQNYQGIPMDLNDGQWHHIVITYDSTYEVNLPPSLTYVEEVNKDNPVLWLRFEDTQPKDYSTADGNHWVGYGAGLSIVNKVGGVGKSAYLSGTNPSYAAATNNPNSPPVVGGSYAVFGDQYAFAPNDITFEIWYKGSSQSNYPYFFQQVGSYTTEPCAPAVGDCDGQIRIWGGGVGGNPWYTGVPPKFDGAWHQLVVTYDELYSGDANMFVQLYMDGELKQTKLITGPKARLGPELSHIMVGARNDIGSTYNAFKGYVDEFAIYAGILDPNRIMVHYSAWQAHNCAEYLNKEPGLAGDINKDCKVDFVDFAELALDWSLCNEPNKPGCSPNW